MSRGTESAPGRRTVVSALRVYAERPALVMVALGFAAGLPYFLIFDTLSAWLRASGLSLEVIGFFSLVTLVSTFKFLWAPFIDRARVPVLTGWLGHRRSWMLVCQGLIMLGLWLVARSDPSRSLGTIAVFAVLVGFASATQDIAIDAAVTASTPMAMTLEENHRRIDDAIDAERVARARRKAMALAPDGAADAEVEGVEEARDDEDQRPQAIANVAEPEDEKGRRDERGRHGQEQACPVEDHIAEECRLEFMSPRPLTRLGSPCAMTA